MSISQYGDYQLDIYFDGLEGRLPRYPVDFASLERKAAEVLPSWVHSYVAGGCGDEGTQRANVDAFSRYGIVPRMLVAPTERDLSVSLFDMKLPTPVFMAPIGVIGLCSQDFHGDVAVAKASAQTGVPMSAGWNAGAVRQRRAQWLRCRQGPGAGRHRCRDRPPVRVRTGRRRHGGRRGPNARHPRRAGPADGHRRLPHPRRPARGRRQRI
jgi:hypothetical protein